MGQLISAVVGVLLLAILALAGVWLLGQLLTGLGAFVVATAGVLGGLLKFMLVAGVLGGLVYFLASTWRRGV